MNTNCIFTALIIIIIIIIMYQLYILKKKETLTNPVPNLTSMVVSLVKPNPIITQELPKITYIINPISFLIDRKGLDYINYITDDISKFIIINISTNKILRCVDKIVTAALLNEGDVLNTLTDIWYVSDLNNIDNIHQIKLAKYSILTNFGLRPNASDNTILTHGSGDSIMTSWKCYINKELTTIKNNATETYLENGGLNSPNNNVLLNNDDGDDNKRWRFIPIRILNSM